MGINLSKIIAKFHQSAPIAAKVTAQPAQKLTLAESTLLQQELDRILPAQLDKMANARRTGVNLVKTQSTFSPRFEPCGITPQDKLNGELGKLLDISQ